PNERTTRLRRGGWARTGSVAGEAKRLQRLLFLLAHAPLVVFDFVVVAEHVQDPVRDEIGELAVYRVPVFSRLFNGPRGRHDPVAEVGRLTWGQHEVGLEQWEGEHIGGSVFVAVSGIQVTDRRVADQVHTQDVLCQRRELARHYGL